MDRIWSHSGENGPEHWADLSEEYAGAKGERQSPIDLAKGNKPGDQVIRQQYRSSKLKMRNNGWTVEIILDRGINLFIGRKLYEMETIHFHSPSEHTVDGNGFALEAHLVHRADDGELAVVAVFIAEGVTEQGFLRTVFRYLPPTEGGAVNILGVTIDPTYCLPVKGTYFYYNGSLTVPPCNEGVKWVVMAEPLVATAAQIERFTTLYSGNSRPVQPLNDREVVTGHLRWK